jgi:Transposase IS116/IS110/IS902 family
MAAGGDRSGSKERLLGISKRGDVYLRVLLIHGARSVIRTSKDKGDRPSQWVTRLAARSHPNVRFLAILAALPTDRLWPNSEIYEPQQSTLCSLSVLSEADV